MLESPPGGVQPGSFYPGLPEHLFWGLQPGVPDDRASLREGVKSRGAQRRTRGSRQKNTCPLSPPGILGQSAYCAPVPESGKGSGGTSPPAREARPGPRATLNGPCTPFRAPLPSQDFTEEGKDRLPGKPTPRVKQRLTRVTQPIQGWAGMQGFWIPTPVPVMRLHLSDHL